MSAAFAGGKGITSDNLVDSLPYYQPAVITEVVTKLRSAGLLHVSQTDNRLLPAALGKGAHYQEIATIILGSETADTRGGARSSRAMKAAAEAVGDPRDSGSKEDTNPPPQL
jgi:hypothetical protein